MSRSARALRKSARFLRDQRSTGDFRMSLLEMVATRSLTAEEAADIMLLEDSLNHPWRWFFGHLWSAIFWP